MAATTCHMQYLSPTPGKITLMAFSPATGNDGMTSTLCQELRRCRFNSATAEVPAAKVAETLQNCLGAGIRPFLSPTSNRLTPTIWNNFLSFCDSLRPNLQNAIGGWMLKSGATLGDVSSSSTLSNCVSIFRNYDNTRSTSASLLSLPLFISALSINAVSGSSSETNYRTYLEGFLENLTPSFWPFIPFSTDLRLSSLLTSYYREFEIFSLMARYTGTPMWAYVKCLTASASGAVPQTTSANLRCAAFSALAYGAQGLVWWTYRSQESGGTTYNGLVDATGNKTTLWNMVQKINTEVSALNTVLCGCQLVGCRHTGTTHYDYTCQLDGEFGPLKSITTGSQGVLVSHLCNKGTDYLMVVSHPTTATQTISLEFNPYWTVSQLSVSDSGVLSTNDLTQASLSLTMNPGDFFIFKWS